jgi:hypothetical protein
MSSPPAKNDSGFISVFKLRAILAVDHAERHHSPNSHGAKHGFDGNDAQCLLSAAPRLASRPPKRSCTPASGSLFLNALSRSVHMLGPFPRAFISIKKERTLTPSSTLSSSGPGAYLLPSQRKYSRTLVEETSRSPFPDDKITE